MSIPTSVAPFFRTQWQARMVDTCHIQRPTGTTLNTTTGVEVGTFADVYGTTGTPAACLVRPSSASDADFGEQQTELRGYYVYVPYDETGIQPGDQVTITSTHDPMLDGLTFTVRNVQTDTYDHRRQLVCEDVV